MALTLQGLAVRLVCCIGTVACNSTSLKAGCLMGLPPTLLEQLDDADVAYHAQPVSLGNGKAGWNILQTLKSGAPIFVPGEMHELQFAAPGAFKQDRPEGYALFGTKVESTGVVDWSAIEITPAAARYLRDAPHSNRFQPEVIRRERLLYALDHLEHEDEIVARDAVEIIRRTELDDLALVFDELPRRKLRAWLQSEKTQTDRIGTYGLLLGLCGTTSDAEILKAHILKPTEEFRHNIELLMFGYLLLTGKQGLTVIEESKLKDPKTVFSETHGAMKAIRLMWKYGRNQLGPERLRSSMRLLLDRPELADLVVADLARMEDWSVQDRLMELYDDPEYDIPSIKRAIVRYLLKSTEFRPDPSSAPEPEHTIQAKQLLVKLTERDPKMVKDAKRFYRTPTR